MTGVAPVELVLGRDWREDVRYLSELRPRRPADTTLNLVDICDIVDLVVDGNNLTAAITEESVFGFLTQVMDGLWAMSIGRNHKAIIEFHCEPWELCLSADGARVLVSLYSVDRRQRVVAHDLAVDALALIASVVRAAEELLADLLSISELFASDPFVRRFSALLGKLRRVHSVRFPETAPRGRPHELASSTTSAAGVTIAYTMDASYPGLQGYQGEHAFDQHALLVPGSLTFESDDRAVEICGGYPVLAVRAILDRVRELLALLESSTTEFSCDSELHQFELRVRAGASLWQVEVSSGPTQEGVAFTSRPNPLLDGLLTAADMIAADLLGVNEHLQVNQRFADLRDEIAELRSWHADFADTNHYHEHPEQYLVEHGELRPIAAEEQTPTFDWPWEDVRALYPARGWTFMADKINFGAVERAHDALFVPTAEELVCLDIESGDRLWQRSTVAGARLSSYSMAGDVLVIADNENRVHLADPRSGDLINDEPVEVGSLLVEATAYEDGELIVVADFHGRLAGLDRSGGARWTLDAGHGLLTGMACHGPVACVLSSPGFVHGLNPATGQLLWKVRLGGLADVGPFFHQGRVYTFSHDPRTKQLTIHAMFPFTGRTAWQARFEGWLAGEPDFIDDYLVVPIERHGKVSLLGIDVESAQPDELWRIELLSAGVDQPTHVSAVHLSGEACGIVRTDTAEITCFRLSSGEVVWRVEHEHPADLLFRNLDLFLVRDAVLCIGEQMQLRAIDDGRLLHEFGDVMVAPEFVSVQDDMQVILGERGAEQADPDQLVSFAPRHFLAVVRD